MCVDQVGAEEIGGIYENVEHAHNEGKNLASARTPSDGVLNLREGGTVGHEKLLQTLPKPLRSFHRSMLCVPIVVRRRGNVTRSVED